MYRYVLVYRVRYEATYAKLNCEYANALLFFLVKARMPMHYVSFSCWLSRNTYVLTNVFPGIVDSNLSGHSAFARVYSAMNLNLHPDHWMVRQLLLCDASQPHKIFGSSINTVNPSHLPIVVASTRSSVHEKSPHISIKVIRLLLFFPFSFVYIWFAWSAVSCTKIIHWSTLLHGPPTL